MDRPARAVDLAHDRMSDIGLRPLEGCARDRDPLGPHDIERPLLGFVLLHVNGPVVEMLEYDMRDFVQVDVQRTPRTRPR